uniref:Uncharacterized protein n=1 Tax=Tolypothrix bouteillei VB521301 TaxID=1479485 RepID=A0A0C1N2Z6_9CYAN
MGLKLRLYILRATRISSGTCAGNSTFLRLVLHLLDFIFHIGKALHYKVRRQKYDGRGATAVDGFPGIKQVAWQKGIPMYKCEGFNKVCTLLFFDLNQFRDATPFGRAQKTCFCMKSYNINLLPSAICPLPFFW